MVVSQKLGVPCWGSHDKDYKLVALEFDWMRRCISTCTTSRPDLPEDGLLSRQSNLSAGICCRAFGTQGLWCAGRPSSLAPAAALAIRILLECCDGA